MLRKIRSRSQAQQSSDSHSFKPGRLLKRKTNSSFRTLINRKTRNVLPVQPDLPFGRFIKPHHEFGNRGFASAVWSGHNEHLSVFYFKADIF